MEYVMGYLLALVMVAVGVLGVILALIVLEVSKPKFVIALVLSLLVTGLGGYYYYVVGQTEKGVANPNVLNSVLKVSTVTPLSPSVTLPQTVPMEMIPSVPREQQEKAKIPSQAKPPVGVKVKR